MANLGNFNAHEVEPSSTFDPLPAGKYLAAVTATEMKATKDGKGSYEIGMELLDAETLQPLESPPVPAVSLHQLKLVQEAPGETVLAEAIRITDGARQADYGHPRDDFAHTALMWTGILAGKLREGAVVTAADVPLCMIAVKLARQSHRHKRDNLVDIAGYSRTAAMVAGEE